MRVGITGRENITAKQFAILFGDKLNDLINRPGIDILLLDSGTVATLTATFLHRVGFRRVTVYGVVPFRPIFENFQSKRTFDTLSEARAAFELDSEVVEVVESQSNPVL